MFFLNFFRHINQTLYFFSIFFFLCGAKNLPPRATSSMRRAYVLDTLFFLLPFLLRLFFCHFELSIIHCYYSDINEFIIEKKIAERFFFFLAVAKILEALSR